MLARLWQVLCFIREQTPIPGKRLPDTGLKEANNMKTIKSIAISLTITAAVSSAKCANLTYLANTLGDNATISVNGNNENVFAGLFSVSLTGAPVEYPTAFNSLCVDLFHSISQGDSWEVNLTPLPNPNLNNSGRAAYLYTTYSNSAATNDDAAGLQLAVWDIVTDGGDGLSTGNFQASNVPSGAVTAANNYLSDSAGKSGSATWLVATNGNKQNLLGPRSVPEPGSLTLIGTCLLPLLGFSRRSRK